jgi:hypothetical protein
MVRMLAPTASLQKLEKVAKRIIKMSGVDNETGGVNSIRGHHASGNDDESVPSREGVSCGSGSNASSITMSTLLLNEEAQRVIFESTLATAVNEVIFPKKQFIVFESELESTGKVAKKILKEVNKNAGDWNDLREPVRRKLNRRRNNAQSNVRRNLYSKNKCAQAERDFITWDLTCTNLFVCCF